MAKNPKVSVIIPCRNEEKYIGMVLQAIYDQSFPIADMEVLIADGMSEDKTRENIEDFSSSHPELDIRILDNIAQIIPAAINLCLRETKGDYIVRMDAHSIPNREYVEISIQDLEAEKGTNVGGIWDIKSHQEDWFSRGIAAAMKNPFGVGDAKYRYTQKGWGENMVKSRDHIKIFCQTNPECCLEAILAVWVLEIEDVEEIP